MRLRLIISCDKAFFGPKDNKLNIEGAFDTIFSDRYPAIHEKMVAVIFLAEVEQGERAQRIEIRREENNSLILETPTFRFSKASKKDHIIIHRFESFNIPAEGKYKIKYFMDGNLLGEEEFLAKVS